MQIDLLLCVSMHMLWVTVLEDKRICRLFEKYDNYKGIYLGFQDRDYC